MRLIFLGQAEMSGSGITGPDGWWGVSGKRSDPAQLSLSLYRVRIALRSGQLLERRVTDQNAAQCQAAIRDKVLRETRKIRDRNDCYDTESLWEGCFIEITSG